ncbi:Beta-barrel assembly-enhancing protease [Tepidimonas alkaliphilus]|uniref:Beta-barrel assembly-enhancing protease n=2 Tax=Tepidimonas alkaliphilus TaxID=2588942 RepID=A0A554W5H8_9BURK|nr:Beta-barrel assembly-enhancing protease [Tepidimonas alkaliphilus]
MTLAGQLRAFGFASVAQVGWLDDARREIERHTFDVVVCGDSFAHGGTGQALLDDLRRSGLLPYRTVFILITDEATYPKVIEAAESAVDSYLVRPFSTGTLLDRIEQAQRRKAALDDIHQLLEDGRADEAVERCLQRFASRGPQALQAARWGAEILMRRGRLGQAQALFQSIWDSDPQPWALLGVARCQLDDGAAAAALITLQRLLELHPDYTDALDALARAQTELGQFADALDSLARALAATPLAIGRQQRLGMLAFFLGDRRQAVELLQRAATLGLDSKMFDAESLVLLALAAFERGDADALHRQDAELRRRTHAAPDDERLQRFSHLVEALRDAHDGRDVSAEVARWMQDCAQPHFDAEAACNLLAALAALTQHGALPPQPALVQRLGLRFGVSKAMSELLARAAEAHPPYAEQLRQCEAAIVQRIEQALHLINHGSPSHGLAELGELALQTLNGRAVDTAWLALQRHGAALPEASEWRRRLSPWRQALTAMRRRPLLGDPRLRPAGGIALAVLNRLNPLAIAGSAA